MTLKKELPIKYFDAATAGSDSASKYPSSATKTSFATDNSVATDAVFCANDSFTMDSISAAEATLTGDI